MRSPADKNKIELFMEQFGKKLKGEGRIYLTGGATALLHVGAQARSMLISKRLQNLRDILKPSQKSRKAWT